MNTTVYTKQSSISVQTSPAGLKKMSILRSHTNFWRARLNFTSDIQNSVHSNSCFLIFKFKIYTLSRAIQTNLLSTHTVFDLITAHTPISTQSSNSVVFRLHVPSVLFCFLLDKCICCGYLSELHRLVIKAYVVGTHLNCIDLLMQFK